MATIDQEYRPTPDHSVGDDVTVPNYQFHGTILDVHVSYRVQREENEISVGEDEELPEGVDPVPLASSVSYLIERQWDGAPVWITAEEIAPGHNMTARSALLVPKEG